MTHKLVDLACRAINFKKLNNLMRTLILASFSVCKFS